MKIFIFIILFLLLHLFSFSQEDSSQQIIRIKTPEKKIFTRKSPEMTLKNDVYNFGEISYESDGKCEFVFKNTGKEPLIINRIKTSCGCTTSFWDKKPILKRKKGHIKILYDTKRIGKFRKTIKVFSNAKNSPVELIISGNVKKNKKN
ncbi:MAG: hypothetical protein B6I24_03850 [Bacteroidetes bacterium 4572_128]|nr:MAG: hypothetical protein B6I24_03850 [Bacteroidetes bacterium 4572_128]